MYLQSKGDGVRYGTSVVPAKERELDKIESEGGKTAKDWLKEGTFWVHLVVYTVMMLGT